eukprot:4246675-Pyramimonas_sp.AAC.1
MLAVIGGQSFVPARCPRGRARRPSIIVHACGRSCILRVSRRSGVQVCLDCAVDDRVCSHTMTSRPPRQIWNGPRDSPKM